MPLLNICNKNYVLHSFNCVNKHNNSNNWPALKYFACTFYRWYWNIYMKLFSFKAPYWFNNHACLLSISIHTVMWLPYMSSWSAQNEGDLIGLRTAVIVGNWDPRNGSKANKILCWHCRWLPENCLDIIVFHNLFI